jgi:alpha-L-rhamnosidase
MMRIDCRNSRSQALPGNALLSRLRLATRLVSVYVAKQAEPAKQWVLRLSLGTSSFGLLTLVLLVFCGVSAQCADLSPTQLRCEYRENPLGIDTLTPRLSWQVTSVQRGAMQTAYRIRVASTLAKLEKGEADLWDSGKQQSDQTLFVPYAGKALTSRSACFWNVSVWSNQGDESTTSSVASWSMGLLNDSDWTAKHVSYRDDSPIFTDTNSLYLPAARQYRKEFASDKQVVRATVYATALGIYELYMNGHRVSDAYLAPGWTDYRQRAYYNTYDVTKLIQSGSNAIGGWVADGWYSGYVGFGLLTGIGTEKTGRATYGKTPSWMAQLEIEYSDGTKQTIGTDPSWKVTDQGPIQSADLLMGEEYDARRELKGWAKVGFSDSQWQSAILAEANTPSQANFYEFQNPTSEKDKLKVVAKPRDYSFRRPKLEAFPGVPVIVTQELPAKTVTAREAGTYVFNLGQNFAGVIRLKVRGKAGERIQIRYAEMLHPDGRLMTENLRKARATDYYTCSGDPNGEVYQPRFTFHGFQYVELAGCSEQPALDAVTGLVLHSDTKLTSTFECSDPMVNQLFSNVVWTQRANFIDLPTDCPQRDERMGWTGDAQAYVATAALNADIGAFYTKWLRELMESQRASGAFPGYAPYPFQHAMDFGTAWADAGVICPWTIWQVYGDTRVIEACWEPMVKFMQWRMKTSQDNLGVPHGNPWGDWLAQGASTPLEYIDTVYYAISSRMMSEMAAAIGKSEESEKYAAIFEQVKTAFQKKYLNEDGSLKLRTQTAMAQALYADLIPADQLKAAGKHLAKLLEENGYRMGTGFLGTRVLAPALSSSGQHDLAVFLLQSREFPSWGYEIENGATTIWERWDSYTKEDSFGRHNAAMNSFSHYAFGAVCEWMFDTLAGLRSDGPGYKKIVIRPSFPKPGSNGMHEAISWVKASYQSIRGSIRSQWRREADRFFLQVEIPANTTAKVYLPATEASSITESGQGLSDANSIKLLGIQGGVAELRIGSGNYAFESRIAFPKADIAIKSFTPPDRSINPDGIDMAKAKALKTWDFIGETDAEAWSMRKNLKLEWRQSSCYLIGTGSDPQLAIDLGKPIQGPLVLGVRAQPIKPATFDLFWAGPGASFSPKQHLKRPLNATSKMNQYLFRIEDASSIQSIRIDPMENEGELRLESITVYQLDQ